MRNELGRRMYLVESNSGTYQRHQNQMRPRALAGNKISIDHVNPIISLPQASSNTYLREVVPNNQRDYPKDSDIFIYPQISPSSIELDSSHPMADPFSYPKNQKAFNQANTLPEPRRSERLRRKQIKFTQNYISVGMW